MRLRAARRSQQLRLPLDIALPQGGTHRLDLKMTWWAPQAAAVAPWYGFAWDVTQAPLAAEADPRELETAPGPQHQACALPLRWCPPDTLQVVVEGTDAVAVLLHLRPVGLRLEHGMSTHVEDREAAALRVTAMLVKLARRPEAAPEGMWEVQGRRLLLSDRRLVHVHGTFGGLREDGSCAACMSEPACTLLLPCRHQAVCMGCALRVVVCPLCRTPIATRLHLAPGQTPPPNDGVP